MQKDKCPKICKRNRITMAPPQRMDVKSCAKKEKVLKPCFPEEVVEPPPLKDCPKPFFCLEKVKFPQISEKKAENLGVQTCKKKSRQKLACPEHDPPVELKPGEQPPRKICLTPTLCYEKIKNPEKPLL